MFGFGTASELATPIGQQVKAATDSMRLIPDWKVNLQICDQINSNRGDTADQALRAIRKRLQDSEPQTVYLALMLMDTCMKNCGNEFAAIVDKAAIEDVATVARNSRGGKNADEALRLIATWGRAYESRKSSFPIFFETYMGMKSRGFTFPKEDESTLRAYNGVTASASPPSLSQSQPAPIIPTEPSTAPITAPNEDEFVKLQLDLLVVMEKVRLCREILLVSPGIKQDEALADVIGFLEACRDRMSDVIEAGSQGMLGEDLFAEALKVNDAVLRTLEAERTGTKINVDDEENPTAKAGGASSDNLLDLNTPKSPPKKAAINDDFLFDMPVAKASPAAAPAPPAASSNASFAADPFGDVFDAPKPPPAKQVAAVASPPPAAAHSVNPFEDVPPPQPPVTAAAAPSPAAGVPDEFDLFLASTTQPQPAAIPAATSTASIGGAADPEFDAFLASLEKK